MTNQTKEGQPQNHLGRLPNKASSLECCQDHKGRKSSLLGWRQGFRQKQQDGADHKLTQWMCRVFRGWLMKRAH